MLHLVPDTRPVEDLLAQMPKRLRLLATESKMGILPQGILLSVLEELASDLDNISDYITSESDRALCDMARQEEA